MINQNVTCPSWEHFSFHQNDLYVRRLQNLELFSSMPLQHSSDKPSFSLWIHSLFLSVFSVKISHQVRFSITTDESILSFQTNLFTSTLLDNYRWTFLSFQTKSFSSTLLDNLLDEPSHFKISLPVHFFIMNSFSLFRHHSLHVCKTILLWTSWVSVASRYQMNFPPLSVRCNYETFHFKNILHESFLFKFLLLWVRFSVNRQMILWYCSTSIRRPWSHFIPRKFIFKYASLSLTR